jgi:murein peptide amidase A
VHVFALAASLLAVTGSPAAGPPKDVFHREIIGHSALGRPIRAVELGNPRSARKVLVVGCIHGNEPAGMRVTRLLARGAHPRRFDLWLVNDVNPDGFARRTRQNGRGVDLNRNFPAAWRPLGRPGDLTYAGPHALSEPESRAVVRFVGRIHPDLTIWFHQPQAFVRAWSGPSLRAARRYARLARVPFRRMRVPPGAATRWQDRRFPGTASFVVELPSGALSAAAAARYARAVRALALAGGG